MVSKRPSTFAVVRGSEAVGRVVQLSHGRLCGLIRASNGQVVFFHRADLVDLRYGDLAIGRSVRFELVPDPISGPRASQIRRR
jgi:cold shock CspA family protein